MKILILGGTVFLGRAIAEESLRQGHAVTLFNRGRSNLSLFPGVEKITGDRDTDLANLKGREWDVAIDTCGYVPRIVRKSARLLANVVDHYTFISSVSVYADLSKPGVDETGPVGTLEDENLEEVTGETYGPLKALCEQEVLRGLPKRALIIRPGLIVGPHDQSDRFTYWVLRISQGGEVLAPKPRNLTVEFIDVRDLAMWTLLMAERREVGVFNAVGPGIALTMEEFLMLCKEVSESDATFSWVDETFLLNREVTPWIEMPLWIPTTNPEFAGMFSVSGKKAEQSGLVYRSVRDTIHDTLAWARTRLLDYEMKAGISREREDELFSLWKEKEING
jgi:2'-hydroxyisoflavone reductase